MPIQRMQRCITVPRTEFKDSTIQTKPHRAKKASSSINCVLQFDVKLSYNYTLGGGGGVLPEKLGGGVQSASQNPYPIYDQNLRYSLL